MTITVKFFASFREATGKEKEIIERAADVASLLEELTRRFGDKLGRLLYEPGTKKLRDTVNILVNGRGINLLSGLQTELRDGDVVAIFPPVSGGVALTTEELERYNRQIIISGFEERGQRKLKRARVLVAGLGGLGSPASAYLVAAGVGHLTILDAERVELSNLNRQILHWSTDVGRPKAASAIEKLSRMNPNVELESRSEEVTRENADELVEKVDVVIDGMDNYPARYLLNEACVRRQIPFIHGAVEGFVGQLTTVMPGKGPCLRCIFPREPPSAQVRPVLGPTPGVVGCLQAMEAIKLIVGIGKPLVGQVLLFDGVEMIFDLIQVLRDPACPTCGNV